MLEAQPWPAGVLQFPEGLPGFESLREFVLRQEADLLPVVFLVSLSEPQVSLPVILARHLRPDYQLCLSEEDRRTLNVTEDAAPGANLLCLAVLNLGDGARPCANLLAPIVINTANSKAKQVIQIETPYSTASEI